MSLLVAITAAAIIVALILPVRWGVAGFAGAAALLFLVQAAISTASGFAGTSIEESLLLFNGSVLSYVGFNMQITYRAFALPLSALAIVFIYRQRRAV